MAVHLQPTGLQASRLRRRKRQLLSRLRLPTDALPGSLSLSHRRCGKPSCHCTQGQGHPLWSLTFMVQGTKRVEHIPADWVAAVRPQVDRGRKFKEEVAELFAVNAQLLVLERKQPPGEKSRKRGAR